MSLEDAALIVIIPAAKVHVHLGTGSDRVNPKRGKVSSSSGRFGACG